MGNHKEFPPTPFHQKLSTQMLLFIGASIVVLILAAMYLSSNHAMNYPMGYYHLAMARLYAENGFMRTFPILPYSSLALQFADQHFLFNLSLIPFATQIEDPLIATSSATLIWIALVCIAIGVLFARMRIPHPALLLLLFFLGIFPFADRISMPRPIAASAFFLILFLYVLYQRKTIPILIVSLLYGWLYHASLQIIPIAFIYFVLVRLREGKWVSALLLAPIIGFSLSLILNPTFPHSITFLLGHTLFLAHAPVGVATPSEWSGISVLKALSECIVPLILLAIALVSQWFNRKWPKTESLHTLLLCLLYFTATVHSVRFFEYLGIFPMLALGLLLSEQKEPKRIGRMLTVVLLSVALVAASTHTVSAMYDLHQRAEFPPERMEGVADYLKANVEENAIIFNTYNGDFPELLYHAPQFRYTEGSNHALMAYYDAELFKDFLLLLHKPPANAAQFMKERFHARHVVISRRFSGAAPALYSLIRSGDGFRIVYKDEYALVAETK